MGTLKPLFCSFERNRVLTISLVIIPAFFALIYILKFGVNVLFWDQWEIVPLINDMLQGQLHIGQLFSQHNEHRIFFPRLAMLSLAYLTHYNTIVEMVASWGILIIVFAILFLLFREKFGTTTEQLIFFIPVSFLFFSTKQWENLLWGWQIQIALCILGFIIVTYSLEKVEKLDIYLAFALTGGIMASFSFFNGLLVWIAGLFYLLVTRKNYRILFAWILSTIVIYAVYFVTWNRPLEHPSPLYIFFNPAEVMVYFLANIGSGLSGGVGDDSTAVIMAVIFGALIVLTILFGFLYDYWNKSISRNAVWWTFVVFSLATSLVLSIGRGGFGAGQSLSSRYVTFTIIGIIGIYFIIRQIVLTSSRAGLQTYVFRGFTIIIIVGIILGNIEGLYRGSVIQDQRDEMVQILLNYTNEPNDQLEKLYPDANTVRKYTPILEQFNYNVYYET